MEGVIIKMLWIETEKEMEEKREKELREALKKEEEKVTIELTKEQLNHIFQKMKYKDGVKRK